MGDMMITIKIMVRFYRKGWTHNISHTSENRAKVPQDRQTEKQKKSKSYGCWKNRFFKQT